MIRENHALIHSNRRTEMGRFNTYFHHSLLIILSGNFLTILAASFLKGWRAALCLSVGITHAEVSFHLDWCRGTKQCTVYCL